MPAISTHLLAGSVDLGLRAADIPGCVRDVVGLLRGDSRVDDFNNLLAAVVSRNAPLLDEGGCGILIAHGRTNAVNRLVLAAGRPVLTTAGLPCLIFAAGIPAAFNSEYLRVVGVIARACRDEVARDGLLAAATPDNFISILSQTEKSL
jgi:mannitol/fructose-specific phosphotransferase system IIA component (Ntr-type)